MERISDIPNCSTDTTATTKLLLSNPRPRINKKKWRQLSVQDTKCERFIIYFASISLENVAGYGGKEKKEGELYSSGAEKTKTKMQGGKKKVGNGHENDRFLPFSRRRGRTTLKRGKLVIGFLEDLALEQVSTPGYFFPVSYLVRLYFYTYQPPLLGRFLWLPLNCINEFYWSKFFLCPFFCLYVLFMSPPVDDLCRFIGAETFYCTPESNVLNWNSDSYGVILCVMIFFFSS